MGTHSKPAKGSSSVTLDGKTFLVNGFEPHRNPVPQALGNAKWLAETLRASTGNEFPDRPVVLSPGWLVEPFPKGSKDKLHLICIMGLVNLKTISFRRKKVRRKQVPKVNQISGKSDWPRSPAYELE
jgi:hypothetical protein